jgi:hypothetical protein
LGVATIELRLPAALQPAVSVWSHPLLGQPSERREGDTVTRRWTLQQAGPRRMERQVPLMERKVAVSLSTLTWQQVGQGLRQTMAELLDDDPVVTAWARAVVPPKARGAAPLPPLSIVNRMVDAVGKRVPFSVSIDDSGATSRWRARTALETGTGSRAWLLYRALRAVGLSAELVLAESYAFATDANFPAHRERFDHPLVIARLATGDVWIDPDVRGPPLPAGHVSVELRGRLALLPSGQLAPIAASFTDAGDEAAIDLVLDEQGNASGSCTIALQGRPAQLLADMFARLVGDERKNVLRAVVLGWLPYANVDEVALTSKEGAWTIEVRARVTLPGYAQREGEAWLLPGLEPVHAGYPATGGSLLGARYAGQGGRQNALAISSALQYRAHRRVQLPASWQVQPVAPADFQDPDIHAARRARVVGKTLEEDFTLSLPTGTIPIQRYARFVATLRNIDDAFLATTRAH